MNKAAINIHGLRRYIPAEIKREIRQRSGFGCAICGRAFCFYEHVDPDFVDAKEHDPQKMCLLCGLHEVEVTRGIRSKESVKEAQLNPRCLQDGFVRWDVDLGQEHPSVSLGRSVFGAPKIVLRIFGEDLLSIHSPEQAGAPVRLCGKFCNNEGEEILIIEDNEIVLSTGEWDLETYGSLNRGGEQSFDVVLVTLL